MSVFVSIKIGPSPERAVASRDLVISRITNTGASFEDTIDLKALDTDEIQRLHSPDLVSTSSPRPAQIAISSSRCSTAMVTTCSLCSRRPSSSSEPRRR